MHRARASIKQVNANIAKVAKKLMFYSTALQCIVFQQDVTVCCVSRTVATVACTIHRDSVISYYVQRFLNAGYPPRCSGRQQRVQTSTKAVHGHTAMTSTLWVSENYHAHCSYCTHKSISQCYNLDKVTNFTDYRDHIYKMLSIVSCHNT